MFSISGSGSEIRRNGLERPQGKDRGLLVRVVRQPHRDPLDHLQPPTDLWRQPQPHRGFQVNLKSLLWVMTTGIIRNISNENLEDVRFPRQIKKPINNLRSLKAKLPQQNKSLLLEKNCFTSVLDRNQSSVLSIFQESRNQAAPLDHHQQDHRVSGHRQRPTRHWEHVPRGVHGKLLLCLFCKELKEYFFQNLGGPKLWLYAIEPE